jgi:hypothetical protein
MHQKQPPPSTMESALAGLVRVVIPARRRSGEDRRGKWNIGIGLILHGGHLAATGAAWAATQASYCFLGA